MLYFTYMYMGMRWTRVSQCPQRVIEWIALTRAQLSTPESHLQTSLYWFSISLSPPSLSLPPLLPPRNSWFFFVSSSHLPHSFLLTPNLHLSRQQGTNALLDKKWSSKLLGLARSYYVVSKRSVHVQHCHVGTLSATWKSAEYYRNPTVSINIQWYLFDFLDCLITINNDRWYINNRNNDVELLFTQMNH